MFMTLLVNRGYANVPLARQVVCRCAGLAQGFLFPSMEDLSNQVDAPGWSRATGGPIASWYYRIRAQLQHESFSRPEKMRESHGNWTITPDYLWRNSAPATSISSMLGSTPILFEEIQQHCVHLPIIGGSLHHFFTGKLSGYCQGNNRLPVSSRCCYPHSRAA
jgi:hypothetical protein